jgi:hypothetical protein
MNKTIYLVILIFSTCFYSYEEVQRESRFLDGNWPDGYYEKAIKEFSIYPDIVMESPCTEAYMATSGPFIGIPLFIIPNPKFPFQFYKYANTNTQIKVTIISELESINSKETVKNIT